MIIKIIITIFLTLCIFTISPLAALIFFLTVYLVKLFKYSYYSTGVVHLQFANIGTGKSTNLARIAKNENKRIKKGKSPFKHVVTNIHIKDCIYCDDIRTALRQGMFEDCLILIEEAGIHYSNKTNSMSMLEIGSIKLIRHYHCSMVLVSQVHNDIDVVIRRLVNQIDLLRCHGNFTYAKPIVKNIDINEDGQIDDRYMFLMALLYNKFIYCPLYYHLFDSFYRPAHVPVIDVLRNMLVWQDGTETPIVGCSFTELESVDGMTLLDKLRCNRNIAKLLESRILSTNGKEVTIKTVEEDIDPGEKVS